MQSANIIVSLVCILVQYGDRTIDTTNNNNTNNNNPACRAPVYQRLHLFRNPCVLFAISKDIQAVKCKQNPAERFQLLMLANTR